MGVLRDLSQQRFGKLLLLHPCGVNSRRQTLWQAVCDCGRSAEVLGTKVSQGFLKSCGCLAVNRPRDISGQRFGRLVAQEVSGRGGSRALVWVCTCDCGKSCEVAGSKLRFGSTQSCGCLVADKVSVLNRTHGLSKTPTYSRWASMRQRALNPNTGGWKNYGGRGIGVSDEWSEFTAFLSDMGECPPGLTLERVDNDLGYSKDNCIWADTATQSRNKRPRFDAPTSQGIPIKELAEKSGRPYRLVLGRLRQGWDIDRALHTPCGGKQCTSATDTFSQKEPT